MNPTRRHRRLLHALGSKFEARRLRLRVLAVNPGTEAGTSSFAASVASARAAGPAEADASLPTSLRSLYSLLHDVQVDASFTNDDAGAPVPAEHAPADHGADVGLEQSRQHLASVPQAWLAGLAASDASGSVTGHAADRAIRSLISLPGERYSLLEVLREAADPAFDPFAMHAISVVHRACAWACDAGALSGPQVAPGLSPRERETLEHLLAGASEKQVAKLLGRSPHTIHSYVKRIYRQLGVSSRAELLSMFLGDGGEQRRMAASPDPSDAGPDRPSATPPSDPHAPPLG